MKKYIVILFIAPLLWACGEGKEKTEALDLMKYGLPIQIMAPAESVVKADDMGIFKDVTVKKGDNYFVQILSTSATTSDLAALKEDQLVEVKKNIFFNKVILDEPNGFIFEKKIDSTFNYDFRYVKIQGSNEYIFQTGLMGKFSEDDVRTMYESVK